MSEAISLTDLPFHELTSRLASHDPVPGGGSASAYAGALAAALVSMVAELTPDDPLAEPLGARARERMAELTDLAQTDADAYARVVVARRMPKATDAEREERRAALRRAMADAASAPLRIAEAAAAVLELVEQLAPIGNPNAASDVGVAGELAAAAFRGAVLNVRINLPYLAADEPLRATLPADVRRLEAQAAPRADRIAAAVASRMEPA
jgi:formiminotetrahydrofolate cyclodeaminase